MKGLYVEADSGSSVFHNYDAQLLDIIKIYSGLDVEIITFLSSQKVKPIQENEAIYSFW